MNDDREKIAHTVIALMRELHARGDFTYGDLAEELACSLGIPLLVAQRSVLQVVNGGILRMR
jgi:hypothetical protein